MSRITKYICDACEVEIMETGIDKRNIDKRKTVINASVYGVHLHTECFRSLTPLRLICILGLDDITMGGERLIYTKDFK